MTNKTPLNILFTTWEGGGNISPVVTAVRRLTAQHRVRVMSDEASRSSIEESGADFVPWQKAPNRRDRTIANDLIRDWESSHPMDGITKMRDIIMAGGALGYAQDTLAELSREPADLIVSSEMTLGVMIAAEVRQIPLAILTANVSLLPIPGIPPLGPGLLPAQNEAEQALQAQITEDIRLMFNEGLPALNAARQTFGLTSLENLLDQTNWASHILLGTSRYFDFPTTTLPSRFTYVGPLLDEPEWVGEWQSPWTDDVRPLILVSFSTTFQDQSSLIKRTIEALGNLPVHGLVTLSPMFDPALFEGVPSNVVVCQGAPHNFVMSEANLVVTHGGHGTVIRALAHGCPLLCLPMGRDQNDNAARVTFHGVGLTLPPTASASEIEQSLRHMLQQRSFREKAARFKTAIAHEIAVSPLVPLLESLGQEVSWISSQLNPKVECLRILTKIT